MKFFWAMIAAKMHGLKFLLRWPPEAHQIASEMYWTFGKLTHEKYYCYECKKVFHEWRRS